MLETIETLRFAEEVNTGSSPMKFLCKNFETYWVKYIDSDGEYYELICEVLGSRLAEHFGIPTPEIDYIRIMADSYDPSEIIRNANIIGSNGTSFGSKDIKNHDILDKSRYRIRRKTDFKKIINPLDFIKIGIFDRYVSNIDRHEDNYNLIVEKVGGNKEKIYAIDHALLFNGKRYYDTLSPVLETSLGNNILRSYLFYDLRKYLSSEEIDKTIRNYFDKIEGVEAIINEVFETFPDDWRYSNGFKERVVKYLTDAARIESILIELEKFFKLKN